MGPTINGVFRRSCKPRPARIVHRATSMRTTFASRMDILVEEKFPLLEGVPSAVFTLLSRNQPSTALLPVIYIAWGYYHFTAFPAACSTGSNNHINDTKARPYGHISSLFCLPPFLMQGEHILAKGCVHCSCGPPYYLARSVVRTWRLPNSC